MDTTGSNVWVLPLANILHFDYGSHGKLIVSTQRGLYEADTRRRDVDKLQKPTTGSWPALSHCSYHQYSERFILAVTAGPPQREILVWDRWSGFIHTVGLYSPRKDRMAFLHDDMHPAWSADASTLAFDSTHTGQGWQVFMAGVTDLGVDMVISMPHAIHSRLTSTPQQRQHILLDIGSGTGDSIRLFIQEHKTLEHELQIYAFEPNPANLPRLKAALARVKTSLPPVVHEAAAWTAEEEVTMMAERAHVVSANHLGGLAFALIQCLISAFKLEMHPASEEVDLWPVQKPRQVQGLDFSRWLLQNMRQEDHVYLQMNAAGAEYSVVERLIVDGSVLLVDEISVVWHDDKALVGWPELFESILTKLDLQSNGPRHL